MTTKEKAIQSGWVYSENPHPVINLNFAYKQMPQGQKVMFEDKVEYNANEIKLLNKCGGIKNKTIHDVKKIFNGEIVSIIKEKIL